MTKSEILDYFKDINLAYNDCTRLDTLSSMLDELLNERKEVNTMKDAVLITHEDFAKVSAKAVAKFVAEFEKTAGTSDMSMTHMLIGIAVTTAMHNLLFKEDEDESNSDQ